MAQRKKADSLWQVLNTFAVKDTAYVNTLNALSYTYRRLNVDSVTILAKQTLAIAEKLDYKKGVADAYTRIGMGFYYKGNHQEAIEHYQKAVVILKKIGDDIGATKTLGNIAVSYDDQGMYELAIKYYEQILQEFEQQNDTFNMELCYYNMATSYDNLGNDERATELFYKSLRMAEQIKDKDGMAWAFRFIGQIYRRQGDTEKAYEYIQKAERIWRKLGDSRQQATCFISFGKIDFDNEHWDSALSSFNKALIIFKKGGFLRWEGISLIHTGEAKFKLGKINEAEYAFEKAIRLFENINERGEQANAFQKLGHNYLAIRKLEKAEKSLKNAYQLSAETKQNRLRLSTLQGLYKLDSIRGKTSETLQYFQQYVSLKDSLESLEKEKQIRTLELQYEAGKNKEQLARNEAILQKQELELKNKNHQFIFASVSAIVLLILFIVFYVMRQKEKIANALIQKKNSEIEKQKEELESSNEQLVELSNYKNTLTSMIVHDLKNPLNSIIGLSEKKHHQENLPLINQAGKRMLTLVLNILDVQKFESAKIHLNKVNHRFDNLIQMATQQVKLLAEEKNIYITIRSDKKYYVAVDEQIMVRVLINLLTNAIKFTPTNGTISIALTTDDKQVLRCSVTDTGEGIPIEYQDIIFDKFENIPSAEMTNYSSSGLGLTFCRLAVQEHGGAIGVNSVPKQGSTFWFTLPIQTTSSFPEQASEEYLPTQTTPLTYSEEELALLTPYFDILQGYDVYEYGAIKAEIEPLSRKATANIKTWLNEIENALLAGNQQYYKQLITAQLTKV